MARPQDEGGGHALGTSNDQNAVKGRGSRCETRESGVESRGTCGWYLDIYLPTRAT